MKIVILTASLVDKKKTIPKCFTTTIGSVALIEYLVRILKLLGVSSEDIYLVTSSSVKWGARKYHKIISSLEVNEIKISKFFLFSMPSLSIALKKFKKTDVLVINGDNFFKLSELEYLLKNKSQTSVALIQDRNTVTSKEPILEVRSNIIKKVKSQKNPNLIPWNTYYGAVRLKKTDVHKINKKKIKDISYISFLVNNLKIALRVKNISSLLEKTEGIKLNELTGGSFAGLEKMILVRKKADKKGRDKLEQEIKWLIDLDKKNATKFPEVVDYSIAKKEVWYNMPWYPRDSLRKNIILGVHSPVDVIKHIKPVLNFLWKNVYKKTSSFPGLNWVEKFHFERFEERLKKIRNIYPFNKILNLKEIIINSSYHKNLPEIIGKVREFNGQNKLFVPRSLMRIHGDLHFQNILIGLSPNDFILMDPRGDLRGSDIYYDIGKLWHSFNGKYDLIHTDLSRVESLNNKFSEFKFDYGPQNIVNNYQLINNLFVPLMKKYPIAKDKDWEIKTQFSEFMHFSSLMYFHLKFDKIENRALSLYLSAIILGSKLIKKLNIK